MTVKTILWKELPAYIQKEEAVLIDLREPEEYRKGHIKGSVSIPFEELEGKKVCLRKDKNYVFYCERGNASLMMAGSLQREGYKTASIYGGMASYLRKD